MYPLQASCSSVHLQTQASPPMLFTAHTEGERALEGLVLAAAAAKSLQSCPTLCDPKTAAHQAPLSLGFSRQEHWSWLPFQYWSRANSFQIFLETCQLIIIIVTRNTISWAHRRADLGPTLIHIISFNPHNSPAKSRHCSHLIQKNI